MSFAYFSPCQRYLTVAAFNFSRTSRSFISVTSRSHFARLSPKEIFNLIPAGVFNAQPNILIGQPSRPDREIELPLRGGPFPFRNIKHGWWAFAGELQPHKRPGSIRLQIEPHKLTMVVVAEPCVSHFSFSWRRYRASGPNW